MANKPEFQGKQPSSDRPRGEGASPGRSPGSGEMSFSCSDVMPECNWEAHGRDESDLKRQIEKHAREHHNIHQLSDDLWNRVRTRFRRSAA